MSSSFSHTFFSGSSSVLHVPSWCDKASCPSCATSTRRGSALNFLFYRGRVQKVSFVLSCLSDHIKLWNEASYLRETVEWLLEIHLTEEEE